MSTAPPPYEHKPYPQPYQLQPGMAPPPQQQVVHIVTHNNSMLGFYPSTVTCSQCQQHVTTRTTYESGLCTWLLCGGIFLLGGIFGCCLIPFCVDGCKDVFHYCPNCNAFLGAKKRI